MDPATKVPFWLLLDRISDSAGLSPQFRRQAEEITLAPAVRTLPRTGISPLNPPETASNGNVTYAGPFRVAPTKITSTILLERNVSAAQIQTEIAWEPRLMPIYLNVQITKVTAVREPSGNKYSVHMLPASTAAAEAIRKRDIEIYALELLPRTHEVPVGDVMIAAELDLPLTLKNAAQWAIFRRADSLAVEGKLSAVVAGPQHPFTFADLARKVGKRFPSESQRVAGVLVTFTALRRDTHVSKENPEQKQNVIVATVTFRYEKTHDAMSSHRTWLYRNPAWLESPDGTKIASIHDNILRQAPNEITLELYFPDTGENLAQWKLVYPRPTGLYAVEYDFLMREVPLP